MKRKQIQGFTAVFFIFWFIIMSVIWLANRETLHYHQEIALLNSILVLPTTTFILCQKILPKNIIQNKTNLIIIQIIGTAVLQAIVLCVIQEGIDYLTLQNIIPLSNDFEPSGPLWKEVVTTLPIILLVNFGFGGLKFYFEHKKLHEKHLQLQRNHLEAQILNLQAQINPHYMFNVLNHIHVLMYKNVDIASELLIKYADILRYQLYHAQNEWMAIGQEVRFMKNYIEVEQYRWEQTLKVTCEWKLENGVIILSLIHI